MKIITTSTNPILQKLLAVLGSQNFLVTILTAILGIFGASAAEVNEVYGLVVGIFGANVLLPMVKIVKGWIAHGPNLAFAKSTNFWVQIMVAVAMLIQGIVPGVDIDQVEGLVRMVRDDGFTFATIMSFANFIYHSLKPIK